MGSIGVALEALDAAVERLGAADVRSWLRRSGS
jgi:hypothetical protein